MTKKIAVSEAKENLPRYLREIRTGESVLITRYGRPVAALVSLESLARLEESSEEAPEKGLAGLAQRWSDGDQLADDMARLTRRRTAPRQVSELGEMAASAETAR